LERDLKLTKRGRKDNPTQKFAIQFTATAMEVAIGRAPWLNNSDTKNHGIDPGPEANMMTKKMTKKMLKYETHSMC
jgi:hypothetical protein